MCQSSVDMLEDVSARLQTAVFTANIEAMVRQIAGGVASTFSAVVPIGFGSAGLNAAAFAQAVDGAARSAAFLDDVATQIQRVGGSLSLAANVYDRAEEKSLGVLLDNSMPAGWKAESVMGWMGDNVSPVISALDWAKRVGAAYLWGGPAFLLGDQSVFERALFALVVDRLLLTRNADHPVEESAALLSQVYPRLEKAVGQYHAGLVMQASVGARHGLEWSRSEYRYGLEGFNLREDATLAPTVEQLLEEGRVGDLYELGSDERGARLEASGGLGLRDLGGLLIPGLSPVTQGVARAAMAPLLAVGGLIPRSVAEGLSRPEARTLLDSIGRSRRISRAIALPVTIGGSQAGGDLASQVRASETEVETPRKASDLVARVKELRDNPSGVGVKGDDGPSTHGEFEIQRHETPGEDRPSWSVIIRGTQEWLPTTHNPKDMQSNLALVGTVTSDEQSAILAAMEVAGAQSGDTVELVGHSQGGLVAGAMASNNVFTSRYNVAGIVTAGAPIQGMDIAPDLPVLAFEHTGDFVAGLDAQPSTPSSNQITIYSSGGDVFAHDLGGYVDDAQAADALGNADLRAWNDNRTRAMGFGQDTKTTQQRYTITRVDQ
ncbi:MAG: hypothetical protein Q4D87_04510 [Actinomycetaceae bacterium]|nr:hypothetical protein [Actinomycetaceae bacterium]